MFFKHHWVFCIATMAMAGAGCVGNLKGQKSKVTDAKGGSSSCEEKSVSLAHLTLESSDAIAKSGSELLSTLKLSEPVVVGPESSVSLIVAVGQGSMTLTYKSGSDTDTLTLAATVPTGLSGDTFTITSFVGDKLSDPHSCPVSLSMGEKTMFDQVLPEGLKIDNSLANPALPNDDKSPSPIVFEFSAPTLITDPSAASMTLPSLKDITKYEITISRSEDCSDKIIGQHEATPGSFQLPKFVSGGTYYVCVNGISGQGVSVGASNSGHQLKIKPATILWEKRSADARSASEATLDAEGALYIAGNGTNLVSETSGTDWWLRKYQTDGTQEAEWDKAFDGNGFNDSLTSIKVDKTGSVYLGGSGQNLADTASNGDYWLLKLVKTADTVDIAWSKKEDYGTNRVESVRAINIGMDGSIIVGVDIDVGHGDISLRKYLSSGEEITDGWAKQLHGANNDFVRGLVGDKNGAVYVGAYGTNLTGAGVGYDWWIKKYAANGTEDAGWDIRFDSGHYHDRLLAIAIDSQGHIYAGGHASNVVSASSSSDWMIHKYDSTGARVLDGWADKSIDKGASDQISSMIVDSKNHLLVGGFGTNLLGAATARDMLMLRFKPDGTQDPDWEFTQDFQGANDEIVSILQDLNNDIYIVGRETSAESVVTYFIRKLAGPE